VVRHLLAPKVISPFALLSILVTAGALFSFLSYRVLRLPTTIGTMILSLSAAAALIAAGNMDSPLAATPGATD
jgi:CPA1 family monovalent cation:H+ antiporter